MRANLIGLAILLAITGAAMLRAEPARCESCMATGQACYGPGSCLRGCVCIQPGGPGTAGWCN